MWGFIITFFIPDTADMLIHRGSYKKMAKMYRSIRINKSFKLKTMYHGNIDMTGYRM